MPFDDVVRRQKLVYQHREAVHRILVDSGVITPAAPRAHHVLLPYRPPLAWHPLLTFLSARAIPGVELVTGNTYRRSIEVGGQCGRIEVSREPRRHALALRAWLPDPRLLPTVVERVSHIFDLAADPRVIAAHLGVDDVLATRVRRLPGLRVPGAWDGFELGVRAILGQQVTVKGASTLAGRIVTTCGRPVASASAGLSHLFPRPGDLAVADLSTLGVPVQRRVSLQTFASALADGRLSFTEHGVEAALDALPGIGAWTVQYVLMRACGDPDAFPASDLWLRRSSGASSTSALIARAEAWRPFRAYAAMYLWQSGT
jgi:AraC family transcriptional regulator, regulatory protein of adaptative response / DNA-3-methyladenine glycosylase II